VEVTDTDPASGVFAADEETFDDESTETYVSVPEQPRQHMPLAERPGTAIRLVAGETIYPATARRQQSPFDDDPGQQRERMETPKADPLPRGYGTGGGSFDRFKRQISQINVD